MCTQYPCAQIYTCRQVNGQPCTNHTPLHTHPDRHIKAMYGAYPCANTLVSTDSCVQSHTDHAHVHIHIQTEEWSPSTCSDTHKSTFIVLCVVVYEKCTWVSAHRGTWGHRCAPRGSCFPMFCFSLLNTFPSSFSLPLVNSSSSSLGFFLTRRVASILEGAKKRSRLKTKVQRPQESQVWQN